MTAAGSRDVVIFDFGGVLVDWDPRYLYRTLFADDDAGMERFLAEVCTPEWNMRQDAGRAWADAVAELSAQHPEHASLIQAFRERWTEMLRGAIDDSVAILDELRRAGRPLYGLTNWSAETFPIAQLRFPFLAWFDGVVVSGVERLIKPDPRLYRCLLERYRIDPARAVFIDDNRHNVDAAVALGIHGIHFQSPAQLRAELVALGLLG
jgi:2-haloacid dehalogenase